MTVSVASPASARLQRLAAYLEQDPGNASLLAEACDAAMACGQHERADAYADAAERLALEPAPWQLRRAHIAIARRDLDRAADLLQALRTGQGEHPVLAHDLAYVHLMQGEFDRCRELVEPWLEGSAASELPLEQLGAMQLLWLRAMHRLQLLDEALEWAKAQDAGARLQPAARGAASLIALDAEDFDTARDFSSGALAASPRQVEALVALGSLALVTGDGTRANQLLQQALECNPDDGRTWSALGMASLLAQDLPRAESQLQRAVDNMPGHVGSWHALGWARLLQGDHAGALAAFRTALEIDRNFAETHGALGLVLALTGESSASRHHLDLADRLEPGNLTGRYARALLAGEAGDRQAVEKLARRWLDRPGFFGRSLGETVLRQTRGQD